MARKQKESACAEKRILRKKLCSDGCWVSEKSEANLRKRSKWIKRVAKKRSWSVLWDDLKYFGQSW